MPLNLTPTQSAILYALACQQQERYQQAYLALLDGDHGKRQLAAWLDETRGLCDKLSRLCAEPPRKSHGAERMARCEASFAAWEAISNSHPKWLPA